MSRPRPKRTTVFRKAGKQRDDGTRSISGPETTEIDDSDDESSSDDDEGEEGAMDRPYPDGSPRVDAQGYPVRGAQAAPGRERRRCGWARSSTRKRQSGILKMSVRIFEEVAEDRGEPATQAQADVPRAAGGGTSTGAQPTARADGKPPAPFLKVSNGTKPHQIKSTINKPVGNSQPGVLHVVRADGGTARPVAAARRGGLHR